MKNKEIFKQEAKIITDMLFDSKFFKDDITRDDMNATEEFILFTLQSRFESHLKLEKLMERINTKGDG